MNFFFVLFLGIFFLQLQISSQTPCIQRGNKFKQRLRGNYKNILSFDSGALIQTARLNYFAGGFYNSIPTRDAIYLVNWSTGFTYNVINQNMEFRLIQAYEINTVFFRLWDGTNRTYNFQVYISHNGIEKLIFDSLAASGNIKLKFSDELVDKIRFFNRGGSTENMAFILIKVEAFYKL